MLSSYSVQPAAVLREHIAMTPDVGGIYAMLLDMPEALEAALARAHLTLDPLRLGRRAILYLGATDDSLRRRLKCHLSNDTCRSTFRMSLGALLAEELNLVARPVPGQRYFGFEPDSEAMLSAWINAHVSVAVRCAPHAMVEEKSLIASRGPVLNIQHRRDRTGAEAVLLLRRQMRGLPFDPRSLN